METNVTLQELLEGIDYLSAAPVIVVIGKPGSGKSYVASIMAEKLNKTLYKTDDYITYGYEQSLYKLMEDIKDKTNIIIEGVQGYRLLRKGQELGTFKPDIIVIVERSPSALLKEWVARGKDPAKVEAMCKANEKVWKDYYALVIGNTPKLIFVRNNI